MGFFVRVGKVKAYPTKKGIKITATKKKKGK